MHDTGGRFEYLDEEERELVESVENDQWIPVEDVEAAKKRARQRAMTTLRRDRRCIPQASLLESSGKNEFTAG